MPNFGPAGNECPPWNDEVPANLESSAAANLLAAHFAVYADARSLITPQFLLRWHRLLFDGLVPVAYYAGNFRQVNSSLPCLAAGVEVAKVEGAHPAICAVSITRLIEMCLPALRRTADDLPSQSAEAARRLATVAAVLIGGFIRIHPFLNGNGRTSRLLWMWLLLRHGLRPQVRVAPRPDQPYSAIMEAAMKGDDAPLALYILSYLGGHDPFESP